MSYVSIFINQGSANWEQEVDDFSKKMMANASLAKQTNYKVFETYISECSRDELVMLKAKMDIILVNIKDQLSRSNKLNQSERSEREFIGWLYSARRAKNKCASYSQYIQIKLSTMREENGWMKGKSKRMQRIRELEEFARFCLSYENSDEIITQKARDILGEFVEIISHE